MYRFKYHQYFIVTIVVLGFKYDLSYCDLQAIYRKTQYVDGCIMRMIKCDSYDPEFLSIVYLSYVVCKLFQIKTHI